MPSSVNGIGTHYYGKKNRSVRQGVCNSCQRTVQLEAYDTRLFFVIVFIPVIPLGKKRIMDYCPACQRHYATNLDQWTAARQLEISSAKEQYRSSPTLENAFQAHVEALRFRSFDEAAELRKEFEEHHSGSAELWSGLAVQLEQLSEYDAARGLYQKAHEIDPDEPLARNGVALARLNEGKLDECRQLLSHLMEPGAGQLHAMGVMDALAAAYQRQGEHEKTLGLCAILIREHPEVANVRDFRKFVQKSEKALGRTESLLPDRDVSVKSFFDKNSGTAAPWQRKLVITAIVAFIACVGLGIHNHYVKEHRTVYLFNSLATPAQVSIDGGTPIAVTGQATVTVPEGAHQAKISGPVEAQVDFTVESGFFDRWFSKPLWIVDVGGGSVFGHLTVYYSQAQRAPDSAVVLGQSFISYPHIDYIFAEPPDSIRTKQRTGEIVKTCFQHVPIPTAQILRARMPNLDVESQLRFAETHLRQRPVDSEALEAYGELADGSNQDQRAIDFLKAGLAERPVNLAWHREYQALRGERDGDAVLVPEYTEMLKSDPDNPALVVLRARVEADWQKAYDGLRKAVTIDPKLDWGWRGLAYLQAARADWKASLESLAHIPETSEAHDSTDSMRRRALVALKNVDELKTELTAMMQLPDAQQATTGALALYEVLIAEGKKAEAEACLQDWQTRIAPQIPSMQLRQVVTDFFQYMSGDVEVFVTRPMPAMPELAVTWVHAALAAGKPELVAEQATSNRLFRRTVSLLATALAFQLKGDAKAATEWAEKAAQEGFAALGPEKSKELLLGTTPPSLEQLNSLCADIDDLAMLGSWLLVRFPDQRAMYEPYVRDRLNFRLPPALLIQKVLDQKAAPAVSGN